LGVVSFGGAALGAGASARQATATPQRADDERVEADALAVGGGSELGVQRARHPDEQLAAVAGGGLGLRGHGPRLRAAVVAHNARNG
jgi:hypothetical protein